MLCEALSKFDHVVIWQIVPSNVFEWILLYVALHWCYGVLSFLCIFFFLDTSPLAAAALQASCVGFQSGHWVVGCLAGIHTCAVGATFQNVWKGIFAPLCKAASSNGEAEHDVKKLKKLKKFWVKKSALHCGSWQQTVTSKYRSPVWCQQNNCVPVCARFL